MLKTVKKFFTRKKRTDGITTRHDQHEEKPHAIFVVDGIYNPVTWIQTSGVFDRYPKMKKNMVAKKIMNTNIFSEMAELVFFEIIDSKDELIKILELGGIHDAYTDKDSIFVYADWEGEDGNKIKGIASMARLQKYLQDVNSHGLDVKPENKFFNSICRTMFNSTCICPVNRIEKMLNKYFTMIDNNGLILMMGVSLDDAIFDSENAIAVDDPYKFIITLAYHDDAFTGITNRINDVIDLRDGFKIGHVSYYSLMTMREEFGNTNLDPRYIDNIFRFIGTLL